MGARFLMLSVLGLHTLSYLAVFAQAQRSPIRTPTPLAEELSLANLEPFVPASPRSESDEDRLLSSTLFTQGRLLFQRERYGEALAKYQRAFQFTNRNTVIAAEIVPLCYREQRFDEAVRYGLMLDDEVSVNPLVLRQLAIDLTERDRLDDAVRFHRRLLDRLELPDDDGAYLITQFEIGRLCFLLQRFDEAADAFESLRKRIEAAEGDPLEDPLLQPLLRDPGVTYTVMAEAFLRAKRNEAATALYRKANFETPNEALLEFHLARVAHQTGDRDEAMQHLQNYFDAKLTDAGDQPYRFLQTLLEASEQGDQLMPKLSQLQQERPEDPYLGYFIVERLLEAKQYEDAFPRLRDLAEKAPTVEGYRALLKTSAELNRVRDLATTLAVVVELMGTLDSLEQPAREIAQNRPLWDALTAYTRRRNRREPAAIVRQSLPMALLAVLADDDAATDEFYALASEGAGPEQSRIRFAWALDMLVGERTERSIEVLQQLSKDDTDPELQAEVLFYLSGALTIEDRYDEALGAARQAAEMMPDVPLIQAREPWIFYLSGDHHKAREAYEDFLQRFGRRYDQPAVRDAVREAKLTVSAICVLLADQNAAEEYLLQVLDEFPGDVGAFNDLGYLWAEQNVHLNRALQMTQAAVASEPQNVAYRDSLGWVLYRLGRFDEAETEIRAAIDEQDPDGIILDHLGDVLQAKGDKAAAVRAWQQSLDELPEEEAVRRQRVISKLEKSRQE